ncbi:MAG TPA: nucleotide exchange factor GrpE [Cytophagaceae bacterium]|jgi:molecular chaperone GrpE|nr:nucleotide exchange factor GrpE [Cytophagaceae bacterium]
MAQEEKDKLVDNQKEENIESIHETESSLENEDKVEKSELSEVESLKIELAEMKDKYIRLYSEFDNFRKRTSKEKIDLIKTANEEVVKAVLPTLDDFERALKSIGEDEHFKAAKEGMEIIFHKLLRTLESKGLKPMVAMGELFNVELHEAITQIPAPTEEMKGRILDEVEKGYYLHDKVIRFAKVVTGA